MSVFSDDENVTQPPENKKPAQQRRSAGLLLSGVLVAISLIAFVLPLAAYHVAQVASVLRVRSGLLLLAGVSVLLYFVGFFTRVPVFVMAGTVGICAVPFLAAALVLRVKEKSGWMALLILAVPIVLGSFAFLSLPQSLNIESVIAENLEKIGSSSPQAANDDLLDRLRQAGAIARAQEFINLSSWQRMAFLLFADAGALALSVLGSLVGTIVLIDFAFSQSERMRGIMTYVLAHKTAFPIQLVQLMQQTRDGDRLFARQSHTAQSGLAALEVVGHAKRPAARSQTDAPSGFINQLIRPATPSGESDFFGYRFTYRAERGWKLRRFAVPLWLGLPAIGLLTYVSLISHEELGSMAWLPAEPSGPLLVWSSVAALAVLVGLALQGALVIHARLRPFVALMFIIVILVLSGAVQSGPLLLAVTLAVLALLDHLYDFRNCLAKKENAV
jgi:hypothetical protein